MSDFVRDNYDELRTIAEVAHATTTLPEAYVVSQLGDGLGVITEGADTPETVRKRLDPIDLPPDELQATADEWMTTRSAGLVVTSTVSVS